jgi:hypothetical protein
MKLKKLKELILQSLEHELGGVKVYTAAITCAESPTTSTTMGAS